MRMIGEKLKALREHYNIKNQKAMGKQLEKIDAGQVRIESRDDDLDRRLTGVETELESRRRNREPPE